MTRDEALIGAALEMAAQVIDGYAKYDQRLCCDGRECGCQGATYQMAMQYYIRAIPVAEVLAKVGQDRLGDWSLIASEVAEQIAEGGGFWRSCSWFHESNEGVPNGPYSHTFQCHLGGGCLECGGIGAVWDGTDYSGFLDGPEALTVAQPPAHDAVARLVEAAKWVRDQSCEGFCRDLPLAGTYAQEMDEVCGGCRVRAALAAMEASHDRA